MKQVIVKIIDTTTNKLVRDFSSEDIFETEENQAAKASILLNYEGADDKYGNLMTSSLTFDLLVSDARDGKFYHLYTGSETKYKVELWTNENKLLWQGFLMPDQYSEPYKNGCFFVSMTASDGIGGLRGRDFGYDSDYYEVDRSIISFITACLLNTGISQDLYFAPAIEATNGFRWDEIYVNGKIYREEDKESRVEKNPRPDLDSCYDILEKIVQDLGCRLYSYEGKWYMIGYNQQHRNSIEFFHYDAKGVYKGKVKQEVPNKKVTFYMNPTISVVSPWNKVEVEADLDSKDEYISDKYYIGEESIDKWIYRDSQVHLVPVDGRYSNVWTKPDQMAPESTPQGKMHLAVWARNFNEPSYFYMELKEPFWVEKPTNDDELKTLEFNLEICSYNDIIDGVNELDKTIKRYYDQGLYSSIFRYEVFLGNELIWYSKASNANNEGVFENRYSTGNIDYKDSTFGKKNFISTGNKIEGKIKELIYNLEKSGWLQIRIYAPWFPNTSTTFFKYSCISKLKLKLIEKKKFVSKRNRDIDYTTKKKIELFHIDNAQSNTIKFFSFKREGIKEDLQWRQSWKRYGVNESKRFGDAYACMIHDLQPVPHIKIDGDAMGILPPTMLYDFHWMEDKRFIPVRLELNFSEAKTAITMIENVYEEFFKTGGIFG
ncbi:hypothetical protein [Myroides marinus]|uniref:hypothetical protein n=1 Tax=Myroides marinus TaxID=703342 RepID=UPI0025761A5B|nr:hypothetical protein [Myroides marinus]MDM1345696.1 hypothetical protein [Myroides marinus]